MDRLHTHCTPPQFWEDRQTEFTKKGKVLFRIFAQFQNQVSPKTIQENKKTLSEIKKKIALEGGEKQGVDKKKSSSFTKSFSFKKNLVKDEIVIERTDGGPPSSPDGWKTSTARDSVDESIQIQEKIARELPIYRAEVSKVIGFCTQASLMCRTAGDLNKKENKKIRLEEPLPLFPNFGELEGSMDDIKKKIFDFQIVRANATILKPWESTWKQFRAEIAGLIPLIQQCREKGKESPIHHAQSSSIINQEPEDKGERRKGITQKIIEKQEIYKERLKKQQEEWEKQQERPRAATFSGFPKRSEIAPCKKNGPPDSPSFNTPPLTRKAPLPIPPSISPPAQAQRSTQQNTIVTHSPGTASELIRHFSQSGSEQKP